MSAWIYHERQDALLCGQHALNNLVQECVFSADTLAEIALQLDQVELAYMAQNDEGGTSSKDYIKRVAEGSGNVDEAGNFSIEVLRAALKNRYGLSLPNVRQQGVLDGRDVTEIEGFICNRDSHWFAIRKINDRYWNLNSTKEKPEQISHFRLAAEIEALHDSGYSVFCVIDQKLPPPCTTSVGRERGLPQYWWKEDDLVKGKSDAVTRETDPWRKAGGGMRLDGKPASHRNSDFSSDSGSYALADGMSEDDMLQHALQASLESEKIRETAESKKAVEVKAEPEEGAAGAVRIQFRLPDGSRVIRRFLESDSVGEVFAFVEKKCPAPGKSVQLRAGFPPADLSSKVGESIKEAKLSGESIQCRHI